MASFGPGLGVGTTVETGEITTETILDEDVSTTAAIARSKIAAGTASHVIINSGTGAFSSEASLAVARGGTALTALGTGSQNLRTNAGATAMEWYTPVPAALQWRAGGAVSTASTTEAEIATFTETSGTFGANDGLLVEVLSEPPGATNSLIVRLVAGATHNVTLQTNSGNTWQHRYLCWVVPASTGQVRTHVLHNNQGTLSGTVVSTSAMTTDPLTSAFTVSLRGSTSAGTYNIRWNVWRIAGA